MMYRLKTTTGAGKVFLGPFVYPKEFAEHKARSISKWHRKPTIQIIEVDKYPPIALYSEDTNLPLIFDAWITRCYFAWANLKKGGDKYGDREDT